MKAKIQKLLSKISWPNFSKKFLLTLLASLLALAFLVLLVIFIIKNLPTNSIERELNQYPAAKNEIVKSFNSISLLNPAKTNDGFEITDDNQDGIKIQFANQQSQIPNPKTQTKINFPKTIDQPISVNLPNNKVITITEKNASNTKGELIVNQNPVQAKQANNEKQPQLKFAADVIKYQTPDTRKTIYYGYQKDQASGEKKLKNWVVYALGNGSESESYDFSNAKLSFNSDGDVQVFFDDGSEAKNQQALANVDQSLIERAQKAIQADAGKDILNPNKTPDFIIPKPYYLDKDGKRVDLDWKISDKTLTLEIKTTPDKYPLTLDPTLAFTAPGISSGGSVITGENTGDYFANSLVAGDFNFDGKTDLAVGAYDWNSGDGRVYIFYNKGSYSAAAANADVIINSETSAASQFGYALAAGDFNADGKIDLAVGANWYSATTSQKGRVYIFNQNAAGGFNAIVAVTTANAIIDGNSPTVQFGNTLAAGDFNADGKTDLAVGDSNDVAYGNVYIFYNSGSYPATSTGANVKISGTIGFSSFGSSLAVGDFNTDGKTDLAVGLGTSTGRVYIFYQNSGGGFNATIAATAANVIISGEASSNIFGRSLATGDFNADGKTDLAVGASGYSTQAGRAYIFNQNSGGGFNATIAASAASTIIDGEASSQFGTSLAAGDFNADGKTDLTVGTYVSPGRAYIFYNDGAYSATSIMADVIITGEASSYFGSSLAVGDFNADGKIDLVVGAQRYSTNNGRAYIFYSQNGVINTDRMMTGEASSQFGTSLAVGDFNADGKIDLAVGANAYSTNTGRAYIFYNDGSIPTTAVTADVIITGEASSYFGSALAAGDFNGDGKTDLAVSAYGYFTNTGRAYIFYNDGTIPTTAATADVKITGEASSQFGTSLAAGDFNADGKIDLAVGALLWTSNTGRAYIFYNDGSIPTTAATADIKIDGEIVGGNFGSSLAAGDFNADGKIDLAVGAYGYMDGINANAGRAYIFYNDGSIPTNAFTADVTITGETMNNYFGFSLAAGDFNADSKIDLAVGAYGYSTNTGRTYIFYNDGSIPTTAATADVIISGETTTNNFGTSLVAGDFNADGKTDLAVGATQYSTNTGRAYIFYNDGTIPTTAATADVIIGGETTGNYFGSALIAGDFNSDGKADLVVGAYGYSSSAGRSYFYEARDNFIWQLQNVGLPGSLRISPAGAGQEMKTTGQASSQFGYAMTAGDFNADGKTDLAVGAYAYASNAGRVYIFYNKGSTPLTAISADVIIDGETSSYFGYSLTVGDFNADGKTDLAVGAYGYSTNTGRAYIFYQNSGGGFSPTIAASTANTIITGETSGDKFGNGMIAGDLNADGKTDLVVSAYMYTSGGRVYVFNQSFGATIAAASANVIITGQTTTFGASLTVGDFNTDGKTDLVVGCSTYSGLYLGGGRVYIFNQNSGGGFTTPLAATSANTIIDAQAMYGSLGSSLAAGDFNADGKTDLAVGAYQYSSNAGRAYIFNQNSGGGFNAIIAATAANTIITGETTNNYFGYALAAGDFNTDGKTDLAVGAYYYSSYTGRAYIFNQNSAGGFSATIAATAANTIITGEATTNYFGYTLMAGDFNADGKTDLVVGAYGYSSNAGRTYLYTFNDSTGSGPGTGTYFGAYMAAGDFNADGKTDLVVGAFSYSSSVGRVYIFYAANGKVSPNISAADVIIDGEAATQFGANLAAGDLNGDGKTDLIVGGLMWSSSTGRAYIFYNDGSYPTTAATADVIISGEATTNLFGEILTTGDFNADGKTDLAVSANNYSSQAGRVYIFYNDGSIPTTAATADVIINGEASSGFGSSLVAGDFNADGKTDLAVGAPLYSSSTGRVYIFYNDGSIPTTAATADVIIDGETGQFGYFIVAGDLNADGKTDLAVSATGAGSGGRVYIFYNDGSIPTTAAMADVIINGESSSGFGTDLAVGDFNADGKTDLVIGASGYSGVGRVYIFFDNVYTPYPALAASADEIITGITGDNNSFGGSLAVGDFNQDGDIDLAIGASGYLTNTGRVSIIITEAKTSELLPLVRSRGQFKVRGSFKLR